MLAIAEDQILNGGGEGRGQMQSEWEGIESVRPLHVEALKFEVASDVVVCKENCLR
jgi:hypothetical protein